MGARTRSAILAKYTERRTSSNKESFLRKSSPAAPTAISSNKALLLLLTLLHLILLPLRPMSIA
jgi:hypothetical protein